MSMLGIIIVTYNASDVIRDCLETLFSSNHPMHVLVVDNASTDGTAQIVSRWCDGTDGYAAPGNLPFAVTPVIKPVNGLSLVSNSVNGGYAAGVNIGIRHLMKDRDIDRFWILNPDTLIPPDTPAKLAAAPDGFSLMGSRILYADPPHLIQTDGGTVNPWTGVTGNLNLGQPGNSDPAHSVQMDFISGASMVASRDFIEHAGPMSEEYFLYYEEVDWAQKRGKLPLDICRDATIYHRAGTAIGSPTLTQIASAYSTYYKYRARMKFLRKFHPAALPIGYLYALAKAGQFVRKGHYAQAKAIICALHGMKLSTDKAPKPRHQPVQRRT